jgi:polyphosphate kinase
MESLAAAAVASALASAHEPPLLNRERSILEFNRRVLAQAQREDVPLLERLRYVTIVSQNLDEFFEVRYADALQAAVASKQDALRRDVEDVSRQAHSLIDEQYAVFNDIVMPALRERGIVIVNHDERGAAQRGWVQGFFEQQVRPLLVPVGLDPAHPFPQVANKSLNFIVRLGGRDAFGRANSISIVKVPRVLPRVMRLPDDVVPAGEQHFVLLSSVIRAHLAELFPGREVEFFSQFRVTRDSDLEIEESEVKNLRQAMRTGLSTRHYGQAVRLEVVNSCPEDLSKLLLEQFSLPVSALYRVNGPVNLARLSQLIDQVTDRPGEAAGDAVGHGKLGVPLRFAPSTPTWPAGRLPPGRSIFEQLRARDLLLHHPFESFEPVVQFLREAVNDPDVLAIKQTIYRTGADSVLMDLLIEAARRGKEVMVVVELKARFDEEANINWAERLEAVGAQVVYGIVGLKTHAKLMLVTRREKAGAQVLLRRYLHLSTGNYNTRTARAYTDLGYLTADAGLTSDADGVFQQIASLTKVKPPRHLLTAPFVLHRRMVKHVEQVAAAARAGQRARIVAKLNALTDPALIHALIQASQAGASIDLVVRGACMLPPGLPGFTERIRVRSIVGRFLEHTRIIYFCWGNGPDDEALYLSSADWMSRNMFGRIEIAWPVREAPLRQRVIDECLVPYLHDSLDAWELHSDGSYTRVATNGVSAQQALLQRFAV